ncbi:transmembrane protein 154 [Danio aesculapii]|uniref:transmembrane protein 154 n=1 Tax=Danio aesculapii TaxID=1142201 RepID=UPI0024BF863F|nr:transmembrane protein 154 [Danio aesculapii]
MNLTLFLLLGLTACWTGLVQSEDEESPEIIDEELVVVTSKAEVQDKDNNGDVAGSGDGMSQTTSDLGSTQNSESESLNNEETAQTQAEADTDNKEKDLNIVIMIIIPLVLTIVISMIVCVVIICRRWRIKDDTKEDAYLDDEDHEKVPMPMFEDDIPSVMELEMEDLENWMAKDGGKKVDTGQI